MLALLTSLGYCKDRSPNVETQAFSFSSDRPVTNISEQDLCTVINNITGEGQFLDISFSLLLFFTLDELLKYNQSPIS